LQVKLHRPNVPVRKVCRLEILLIAPTETNVSKNDVCTLLF